MSSTAHDDQYTTAPEPLRQPYDTVAILKRNVADLEVALRKQTERAESYAETLRSLASYVGVVSTSADTVDADVFEGKIRWGIGEIQDRLAGAIERELVNRSSLITARNDIQTWIDSRNKWMARAEAAEAELAKLAQQEPVAWKHENGNIFLPWQKDLIVTGAKFSPLYADPVPAPAVPATYEIEDQLSLAETEMINAKAWSAGSQSRIHIGFAMTAISCARALLQSAKVTDNAAADRLMEGGA